MSTYLDEVYVAEILRAARPGMTPEEFNAYVQKDLNAGYVREVTAARIEYFRKKDNAR